jgi:hypothetical protein
MCGALLFKLRAYNSSYGPGPRNLSILREFVLPSAKHPGC